MIVSLNILYDLPLSLTCKPETYPMFISTALSQVTISAVSKTMAILFTKYLTPHMAKFLLFWTWCLSYKRTCHLFIDYTCHSVVLLSMEDCCTPLDPNVQKQQQISSPNEGKTRKRHWTTKSTDISNTQWATLELSSDRTKGTWLWRRRMICSSWSPTFLLVPNIFLCYICSWLCHRGFFSVLWPSAPQMWAQHPFPQVGLAYC